MLFGSPNGLELTGDGGAAAGVRCSDVFGGQFLLLILMKDLKHLASRNVPTIPKMKLHPRLDLSSEEALNKDAAVCLECRSVVDTKVGVRVHDDRVQS
jgi:hypothetical protein